MNLLRLLTLSGRGKTRMHKRFKKGMRIPIPKIIKKLGLLRLKPRTPPNPPLKWVSPSSSPGWEDEMLRRAHERAAAEDWMFDPKSIERSGFKTKKDADGNILYEMMWFCDTPSPRSLSPPPSPADWLKKMHIPCTINGEL